MDCAVCLECINKNSKELACGHSFHLECILNWFVTSERCPMCRACQKEDPLIKFKHKIISIEDDHDSDDYEDEEDEEDEDDFDAESQYNHYRESLRRLLHNRGDVHDPTNFEQSLRRAMAYEMTTEDLEGPGGLIHTDAEEMIEYQDAYRSPDRIENNWRFTELDSENGVMRRVNRYESTMEDLMGYFLMSREGAKHMIEYQDQEETFVMDAWQGFLENWERNMHDFEREGKADAVRRVLALQATFDDVMLILDNKNDALDLLAYQHYTKVKALLQTWINQLPVVSGVREEAIKRVLNFEPTMQDLTHTLGLQEEEAIGVFEYQQARRTKQNIRSV